MQFSAIMYSYI